jgi:hypothetical protein
MILAYAVAARGTVKPPEGLNHIVHGSIESFYRDQAEMPQVDESAVREFFTTNQTLFAQSDILEFRYPTVLRERAELERFLDRHAASIALDLQRLRNLAQLAVYLPKRAQAPAQAPQSGTAYLQQKRAIIQEDLAAIDAVREAAGSELRDSLAQNNRLLLLVSRQRAPEIAANISRNTGFEVSGPFPPSGFAKLLS